MKLKELKAVIDKCVENVGELNPDVEVWYKNKMYRIAQIGQYGVIPDVTITISHKELDQTDL